MSRKRPIQDGRDCVAKNGLAARNTALDFGTDMRRHYVRHCCQKPYDSHGSTDLGACQLDSDEKTIAAGRYPLLSQVSSPNNGVDQDAGRRRGLTPSSVERRRDFPATFRTRNQAGVRNSWRFHRFNLYPDFELVRLDLAGVTGDLVSGQGTVVSSLIKSLSCVNRDWLTTEACRWECLADSIFPAGKRR